jgi:hypothetical protein
VAPAGIRPLRRPSLVDYIVPGFVTVSSAVKSVAISVIMFQGFYAYYVGANSSYARGPDMFDP